MSLSRPFFLALLALAACDDASVSVDRADGDTAAAASGSDAQLPEASGPDLPDEEDVRDTEDTQDTQDTQDTETTGTDGSSDGGAVGLTLVAAPVVTGAGSVGSLLVGTDGLWDGVSPITLSRQWERCAADGSACAAIAGATELTYTVTAADASQSVRLVETAVSADGSDAAASEAVAIAAIPVVSFVVLGDAGTGDSHQYGVAKAVEDVCTANPCDFALYVGDNVYDSGVDGIDDSQWQTKFELPYKNLDFPFYAVLGNHDYGGAGAGFEEDSAQAQVDYTASSDKWKMPSHYYAHAQSNVTFFGLDTNAITWNKGEAQESWLPDAMAAATTPWKIVFGHHTYASNGPHGTDDTENFSTFFENYVCGKADVYLNGHDHSLQWLEPQCGTEILISGAAGKKSAVGYGNVESYFEAAKTGFLWVELSGDTFTGVYYDEAGTELYRRSFTRTAR